MIAHQEEVPEAMSVERSTVADVTEPDDHLNFLLSETQTPWYKGFVENIRDLISPKSFRRLRSRLNPFLSRIYGETARTLGLRGCRHADSRRRHRLADRHRH